MCRKPIVKKYREGKMKRTLKRGLKEAMKQAVIKI